MKKTLMIDLDGVLNTYEGNFDENTISPVKEGAKEFLEKLNKDYNIQIFTVRNKKLTYKWLIENNLIDYIQDISEVKNPHASVFIDDRALRFDGDYQKAYKEIQNFNPYWK